MFHYPSYESGRKDYFIIQFNEIRPFTHTHTTNCNIVSGAQRTKANQLMTYKELLSLCLTSHIDYANKGVRKCTALYVDTHCHV